MWNVSAERKSEKNTDEQPKQTPIRRKKTPDCAQSAVHAEQNLRFWPIAHKKMSLITSVYQASSCTMKQIGNHF